MALVGLVCGATTWDHIIDICSQKKPFLRQFMTLRTIPSHDTFERVFSRLDPDAFAEALTQWVLLLQKSLQHKHIAFDGKSSRRSFSSPDKTDMLHTTSLFLVE
jgi:hypothetical protein